jgi:hypothetical protein
LIDDTQPLEIRFDEIVSILFEGAVVKADAEEFPDYASLRFNREIICENDLTGSIDGSDERG